MLGCLLNEYTVKKEKEKNNWGNLNTIGNIQRY